MDPNEVRRIVLSIMADMYSLQTAGMTFKEAMMACQPPAKAVEMWPRCFCGGAFWPITAAVGIYCYQCRVHFEAASLDAALTMARCQQESKP